MLKDNCGSKCEEVSKISGYVGHKLCIISIKAE